MQTDHPVSPYDTIINIIINQFRINGASTAWKL